MMYYVGYTMAVYATKEVQDSHQKIVDLTNELRADPFHMLNA
jgi:hypothetical protein